MDCPDAIVPGNPLSDPACALQAIFQVVSLGLNWGILGAAVLALIFLIMGGFKWIMAGDDPKALQNAQTTIFWAVVGLVLAASTFGIMRMISSAIPGGLPGFPQPTPAPIVDCGGSGDPCCTTVPRCQTGLSCVGGMCQ